MAQNSTNRSWWSPVVAMGAVLGLRLALAVGIGSPHLLPDEIGYLGAARLVAGRTPDFSLGSASLYHPLYSALLAPVFALGPSPHGAFRAVLVANAVLGALTTGALYLCLRRWFGATVRGAAVASAVAGLYPGQALLARTAWAENLLPIVILGWVSAIAWFLRRPKWDSAITCVVGGLACYFTHPRGLVMVAITAVVFVAMAATRKGSRGSAIPGLVALALGYVLSRAAIDALLEPLYRGGAGAIAEDATLDKLFDPASWGTIARTAIGQLWYQVVATAGLVVLGGDYVVRRWRARTELDPDDGHGPAEAAPMVLLGTAALVLVVSSVFVSGGRRVDSLFYGRYVDAVTPLLVAAGVLSLWQQPLKERARTLASAGGVIVTSTLVVLVALPHLSAPRPIVSDMVLGLAAQIDLVGVRAVPMAGIGLALLLAALATGLLRRYGPATVLALGFAGASLYAAQAVLSRPFTAAASLSSFANEVATQAHDAPVGVDFDSTSQRDASIYGYQWFRPDLHLYDLTGALPGQPRSDWLIGSLRWRSAEQAGAALVAVDPSRAIALWVLPGSQQERLRRDGGLLPNDFPALLPPEATRAGITVPTHLTVDRGADATFAATIVHEGHGYRWPHFDPTGAGFAEGQVRVGARIWRRTGDRSQRPLASVFTDLPRDLLPGQTTHMAIDLGSNLEPGQYTVTIDLLQINGQWFNDPTPGILHLEIR